MPALMRAGLQRQYREQQRARCSVRLFVFSACLAHLGKVFEEHQRKEKPEEPPGREDAYTFRERDKLALVGIPCFDLWENVCSYKYFMCGIGTFFLYMWIESYIFRHFDFCQYPSGKCHIPLFYLSNAGFFEFRNNFGTGNMVRVSVKACEIVGDKKIRDFLFDKRGNEYPQLLLFLL